MQQVKNIGFGIVGAILVLVAWIAYQDHVAIREVVAYINQINARAAQTQAAQPAPKVDAPAGDPK